MIEADARVTSLDGGRVEIVTLRQSACNSCATKDGCGTSLIARWFPERQLSFWLPNDIDARVGDRVVLGLDEGRLQRHSLLLYALPLAGLLAGALAGDRLFEALQLPAEPGAIAGGLLGMIAALLHVRRRSSHLADAGNGGIRLLRVVPAVIDWQPEVLAPIETRNLKRTDKT
jgi:sigma-E factor negative regulatory protein RseC